MPKETIISRVYSTKNGETIINFKFKFGDLSMEEKENFLTLWREGTPLELSIEASQKPEPEAYESN